MFIFILNNNKIIKSNHKESTLLPIIKPDKNPKEVKSYKPITLLSFLGTLIEKMVYFRLYTYFEYNNRIPKF